MKAVIMAGGEGTRLRPLTCNIPKPMVPIAGKPAMEHIVDLLKKYGITDIAVTLFYLPDVITEYFEDGEKFGVKFKYYIEQTPLGTGGSVLNAHEFLNDTFIVISGDAITDINLKKAIAYHNLKKSKATLVLKKESIPLEYGIVIVNEDGSIARFLEKPSWGEVFSDTINTGIYILEPEIFRYYKQGDNFDFSKDLFPKLLKNNVPMYGYITNEYWCDIGDLNSYRQTHFDILDKKISVDIAAAQNDIWVGKGSIVAKDAKINPPVLIGENCTIKSGVFIDSYSVIGNNCIIDEGTTIKKSILWNNCIIGKNNQFRKTILCSKNIVKDNVNTFEDSVIGAGCIIHSRAAVNPGIKIWPNKRINENAIVNMNMVWGISQSRNLFGSRGISGEVNTAVAPEAASLIASAFTIALEENGPVVVSCDASNSSKMIKQSVLAGVMSAGTNAIGIDNIILPISRFASIFYKAAGGIHIHTGCSDTGKISIEFINKYGGNIDRKHEKKVENLFFREDFQRCQNDTAGSIIHVENFFSFYIQHYASFIENINKIKVKKPEIAIASFSSQTAFLAASFLEYIGCSIEINYESKNFKSLDDFLCYFSKTIPAKNMDMGIVISENGENAVLIDSAGRIIAHEKYLLLSSLIILKSGASRKLILPYAAPLAAEQIAKKYGASVIRSKSDISDITNSMLCNPEFQFQYLLNFDGIQASAKIIDFLAGNDIELKELADEIPEFYIKKAQIPCDFKDRGKIINQLINYYKGKDIELFEGIRINSHKGWTQIFPDNEKPVFNIFTEGLSAEYAQDLTDSISARIEKILKANENR